MRASGYSPTAWTMGQIDSSLPFGHRVGVLSLLDRFFCRVAVVLPSRTGPFGRSSARDNGGIQYALSIR